MNDTSDRPTLSASDVALMRQLIAWRKANDIEFVKRRIYGAPYWVDAFGRTGPKRREVVYDRKQENTLGLFDDDAGFTWLAPVSLTQAVDVLVAYGYLPARFSSAYRAGWDSCDAWRLGPPRISGPDGNDLRPASCL